MSDEDSPSPSPTRHSRTNTELAGIHTAPEYSDDNENNMSDMHPDSGAAPENRHPTFWARVFPWFIKSEYIDTLQEPRLVFCNRPELNAGSLHCYPSNGLRTTKYTLLTFLPQNLFEQFQKAANFYFLMVAIIVSIPGISTIEPYTSILPLVFVLSITAIKEAYEDYKRYKEDVKTNTKPVDVMGPDGNVRTIQWQDIRIGDIIQVYEQQELPADMVLLSSTDPAGSASIMTANLDGETNLKTRISLKVTMEMRTPADLCQLRARCRTEPPNRDLTSFEGVWIDRPKNDNVDVQLPITADNLMLRGCKLVDTESVFGLVVYTGIHTKQRMNASNPRHKRSNVEKVMNKQMYLIFLMQFLLVLLCAIVSGILEYTRVESFWYLVQTTDIGETFRITARNFAAYYILYNVMVPISLYVSMELVKVAQAVLIWYDVQIYDPITDTRATARTSNLNEELGQIKYIFSDKTGTLTQNKMSFYKCSVNGVAYGKDVPDEALLEDEEQAVEQIRLSRAQTLARQQSGAPEMDKGMGSSAKFADERFDRDRYKSGEQARVIHEFLTCMAVCHNVSTLDKKKKKVKPPPPPGTSALSMQDDVEEDEKEQWKQQALKRTDSGKVFEEKSENKQAHIEYRGVSIDEVALVIAANELGYRFTQRTRDEVFIDTPKSRQLRYEILHLIDFTSDRRRMSIICRTPEGKLRIYMKGADSAMLTRLASTNKEAVVSRTKRHLEDFSLTGLRTLVVGMADIDEKFFVSWNKRYEEASNAIGNRKQRMEDVANEIEQNLTVLGVTAIEDALQVGVVDTLQRLAAAGIKVWMLTGDKRGTAVNIGKSCGLVDAHHEIIYLDSTTGPEMEKELSRTLDHLDAKKAGGIVDVDNNGGSSSKAHPTDVVVDVSKFDGDEKKSGGDEEAAAASTNKVALVVDGPTLKFALLDENQDMFFRVINHPQTQVVVCSRMAPKQKAMVVKLIKTNLKAITLAIGDGANDVSMIQAAHVGVGIRGKEGLQAVNNSDYAIGQFRFLARLLLVHGRLSYKRNTRLILYSFYKSMMITFTQFYFTWFSGFSGQEIYDGILLNTFNLFFASLPILGVAVFDRDLEASELMRHPQLYRAGIKNTGFNYRVFWTWIFTGVWHGIWVFFIMWFSLQHLGLWAQGIGTYSALVVAANFRLVIMTNTWTAFNHAFTWGSIALWFLFGFAVSSDSAIDWFPSLHHTFHMVTAEPEFWLSLLFIAWMSMWQDYLYSYVRFELSTPSLKLLIQLWRNEQKQPGPAIEADLGAFHAKPVATSSHIDADAEQ